MFVPSASRAVATVRGAALANFAQVAGEVGLNPRRALREAGLDWEVLSDPDRRVPAEKVASLLERAAHESGCETFGLRMAELRRLSDFGAVSLLIAHQPTLRDALETTVRYRHLLNEALAMHVEEAGDIFILREELILPDKGPARQACELAIGAMFRMLRALLGPRWRPYSVRFAHGAPDDLSLHRRVFGAELQFDSDFNGFVCPLADLDRANPAADPAMARYARRYVDELARPGPSALAMEVRRAAHLLLPVGRGSIGAIAKWLGMNVRTLQRRLEAEGEEFSQLLNEVRQDLAMRYLANPALSMIEVARLLGYGQPSSFSRWFKSEFGVPPSAYVATDRAAATDRSTLAETGSRQRPRWGESGSGRSGGSAPMRISRR